MSFPGTRSVMFPCWNELQVTWLTTLYLQVAYLLADESVISREFGVLESVKDNYPKMVLSMDRHFGSERNGIQWCNLIDFLLRYEL